MSTELRGVIAEILRGMSSTKGLRADAAPAEIVGDSLDQMRFIVEVERTLNRFLDDEKVMDIKFRDLDQITADVAKLLEGVKTS